MLFDISGGFRCILAHQIIASTEIHAQTGIHLLAISSIMMLNEMLKVMHTTFFQIVIIYML